MQTLDFAIGFAACAHRLQKRKYTEKPYLTHCLEVMQVLQDYIDDVKVLSAAVMHDVLEDTDVTADQMRELFGERVTVLVLEVTNVAKPEDGDRAARKGIDREHLARTSFDGANIKLCDLISNTGTIAKYDPVFAKVYLEEKRLVLPLLSHGHPPLFKRAAETLSAAVRLLEQVHP